MLLSLGLVFKLWVAGLTVAHFAYKCAAEPIRGYLSVIQDQAKSKSFLFYYLNWRKIGWSGYSGSVDSE